MGDGINQFSFDLTINPGSSVSELFFEITNLTEGETWQYALTLPAFGTNTSFLVPLSGAGWTQTSGDENFAFILGQTEEISIVLGSATAGNVSGSIDNFASIPEPSTTIIAALGLLTAISRRRRQDV
ncbi:MAG: PEP-CTERM sorting domain-containing protein [Akkermansiaceae bacterium]|nr:PEP-CTERM sorting domain-containing protein [Akkermansiaceae bacterium]